MTLHHIGIVVEDIGTASQIYASTYGYEVCSEVFHDAVQTAHVQFLKLPSSPTFVELVAPDSGSSKLAGALRKGGGLNHLCFATDDLDQECADFRRRGLFPLQAPVAAVAFNGRRIAWFLGRDRIPIELVERGGSGEV